MTAPAVAVTTHAVAVTRAQDGRILTLTLDRPQAANAIDGAVADGLAAGLGAAAADAAIGAVILTAAGVRAFSGGIDLKANRELAPAALAADRLGRLLRALEAVIGFPKPLVVAVNGVASGGGAMLALLGDRVLAAEGAAFVLPEIDLDMPSLIGLELLTWIAGEALAAELILTGRRLGATEAAARHVIAGALPADALMTAARREAEALAAKPARAYGLVKAQIAGERRRRLAAAVAATERLRRA